jgi:hypothetical protein
MSEDLGPLLRQLRDKLVPREESFDRLRDRKVRAHRNRQVIGAVIALVLSASAGVGVWGLLGLRGDTSSPAGEVTSTPNPEPSLSPSQGQTCGLPRYQPTYLPWLGSGEQVPAPQTEISPAGGGPQAGDPGYSMLVWGFGDITEPGGPERKGSLALWRSTESAGVPEPDPEVPPLPDGAAGVLSEGEGEGGWAIRWADPSPSPYADGCSETTLVLAMPNLSHEQQRNEIIKIAESLVQKNP